MTVLENKYYMDWISENIVARGTRLLGTGLWRGGDQAVIDGLLVNGSWKNWWVGLLVLSGRRRLVFVPLRLVMLLNFPYC